MRFNPVIFANIYRPWFEFAFHNTKTLLYLPSLMVCLCYFRRLLVCKICWNSIETVKSFLLPDVILINGLHFLFCNLSLLCTIDGCNETSEIIGILLCANLTVLQSLPCAENLSVTNFAKVVPVFDRVGDNQSFIKIIIVYGKFLVENSLFVFSLIQLLKIVFTVSGLCPHKIPAWRIKRHITKLRLESF